MRKCILTGLFTLLVFVGLKAQKTPHPEYLMRYYFTAVEGAKQSVVPQKVYSNQNETTSQITFLVFSLKDCVSISFHRKSKQDLIQFLASRR